jgi:hypothetical protein
MATPTKQPDTNQKTTDLYQEIKKTWLRHRFF